MGAQPPLAPDTPVIHPFYQASFAKLYGLGEPASSCPDHNPPTENNDFLLPLLRAASWGYERNITRFYDVRTTEEYGHPAPEYALLAGAGLNHVSPLGVKGMGPLALPFALLLAEAALQAGETALFCCAELYTPLDGGSKSTQDRRACAFLLRSGGQDAQTYITGYACGVPKETVCAAAAQGTFDVVCFCGHPMGLPFAHDCWEETDFIEPFLHLQRLQRAKEEHSMLIVCRQDEAYGYIQIQTRGRRNENG